MRDVAREAEVSLKTVSRVVNDEGGVRPGLEERVRSAIQRLGYQPDDRARHLRSGAGTSRSLGFVQMDVANPFFSAVFRGLEDVAQNNRFLVLSGSSDADPEREEALVRAFIARRVAGLVIASGRSDLGFLKKELEHGTPVVFLDIDAPHEAGDVVRTDHYDGAATATRHLINHGHRDIAFLGDDPAFFSTAERRRGFATAMTAAGLPIRWDLTNLTSPGDAKAATLRLMEERDRPTAIFAAQNLVTIGAVTALHQLGLEHRVALVGFDDLDLAELVSPRITVVAQHPRLLGLLAAEQLFARLAGDRQPPERHIIKPELVVRGSGEIAPN